MDLGLKEKVAFIAGAARGLGAATALQLAREGTRVAINDRDADKLQATVEAISQETGAQVLGLPGDVSDPKVPSRLVQETVKGLGGLDILGVCQAHFRHLSAASQPGEVCRHRYRSGDMPKNCGTTRRTYLG